MNKTKWILALIVLTVAYSIALVLTWQSVYRPYERPPVPTKAEVKQAHKKYGFFTIISTRTGSYMKTEGGVVWLTRKIR